LLKAESSLELMVIGPKKRVADEILGSVLKFLKKQIRH